ncbi:MAG: hypothetical protein KGJ24_11300 [Burkholderiales bacterium]|nr:hypothetical protein [Burkholderiales bacterium]
MAEYAYERRQWLRVLWLLLPLLAVVTSWRHLAGIGRGPMPLPAALISLAGPALVLLVMGCFTVQLDAKTLRWRFGFVGWPRWQVRLAEITAVEVTRSRWTEGAGIRRTCQGWLYNAAPGGAVRISLRSGKVFRLGSDEPERLAAMIRRRLPQP